MIQTPPRIIGIRPVKGSDGTPTGRWAVVGEKPVGHDGGYKQVLVSEHANKGGAIRASGSNRVLA